MLSPLNQRLLLQVNQVEVSSLLIQDLRKIQERQERSKRQDMFIERTIRRQDSEDCD